MATRRPPSIGEIAELEQKVARLTAILHELFHENRGILSSNQFAGELWDALTPQQRADFVRHRHYFAPGYRERILKEAGE